MRSRSLLVVGTFLVLFVGLGPHTAQAQYRTSIQGVVTDSTGAVHAKTGSLSISIALSGYVTNKYDNQVYLFSFVGNNGSIDQANTRQAMEKGFHDFGIMLRITGDTLALSPPLIIKEAEIDEIFSDKLPRVLKAVA